MLSPETIRYVSTKLKAIVAISNNLKVFMSKFRIDSNIIKGCFCDWILNPDKPENIKQSFLKYSTNTKSFRYRGTKF